jgi:hypothetical protein
MSGESPTVRQIAVDDSIATGARYDYADAFVIDLPGPDTTPPERWLGTAFTRLPWVVDWITTRLGFSGAGSAPLDGWDIQANDPDLVHLVTHLPMAHVDFVGRNTTPTRRTLTTLLTYRRPWLGRLVWLFVGPVHRRTARWLLSTSLRPEPVPR